jgi:hypothetical protein
MDYRISVSNGSEEVNVQATSYSEYGIHTITVAVGSALTFVTYEVDDNVVYFTILLSDSASVGIYTI